MSTFRTYVVYFFTPLLLFLIGLVLCEVLTRSLGYFPWVSNSSEILREKFTIPDAEIGWIPRPRAGDRYCTTGGTEHTETVRFDGTRLVTSTPKSSDAPKILVLGDSSIFGWGLDDDKTFASFLAEKLPDMEVINAAVPGYGTLQSYMWMERIWSLFHPKYVILGYADYYLIRDSGSVEWARLLAQVNIHNNIDLPYARLEGDSLEVVPSQQYFLEIPGRNNFAIVSVVEQLLAAVPASRRTKSQVEITKEIFRKWAQYIQNRGAIPIIMFWDKDRSKELFEEFLRSINVMVINCVQPNQREPETILPDDGHPSAVTTRFWSNCVSDALLPVMVE